MSVADLARGLPAARAQPGARRSGTAAPVSVVAIEEAAEVRRRIFAYDLVMFALLLFLAWSYFHPGVLPWSIGDWVPQELQGVPVYAFWLGALGGIVISLKGIYDHGPADWQVN